MALYIALYIPFKGPIYSNQSQGLRHPYTNLRSSPSTRQLQLNQIVGPSKKISARSQKKCFKITTCLVYNVQFWGTDRQTNRQTDRQRHRQTHRQTSAQRIYVTVSAGYFK